MSEKDKKEGFVKKGIKRIQSVPKKLMKVAGYNYIIRGRNNELLYALNKDGIIYDNSPNEKSLKDEIARQHQFLNDVQNNDPKLKDYTPEQLTKKVADAEKKIKKASDTLRALPKSKNNQLPNLVDKDQIKGGNHAPNVREQTLDDAYKPTFNCLGWALSDILGSCRCTQVQFRRGKDDNESAENIMNSLYDALTRTNIKYLKVEKIQPGTDISHYKQTVKKKKGCVLIAIRVGFESFLTNSLAKKERWDYHFIKYSRSQNGKVGWTQKMSTGGLYRLLPGLDPDNDEAWVSLRSNPLEGKDSAATVNATTALTLLVCFKVDPAFLKNVTGVVRGWHAKTNYIYIETSGYIKNSAPSILPLKIVGGAKIDQEKTTDSELVILVYDSTLKLGLGSELTLSCVPNAKNSTCLLQYKTQYDEYNILTLLSAPTSTVTELSTGASSEFWSVNGQICFLHVPLCPKPELVASISRYNKVLDGLNNNDNLENFFSNLITDRVDLPAILKKWNWGDSSSWNCFRNSCEHGLGTFDS